MTMKAVNFQDIVKSNIPRSEDWMQRRWGQKQKKNIDYDQKIKV